MRLPDQDCQSPATAVGRHGRRWVGPCLPAATSGASAPKVATTIVAPMGPRGSRADPRPPEPTSTASESARAGHPRARPATTYADPPRREPTSARPACGPGETAVGGEWKR